LFSNHCHRRPVPEGPVLRTHPTVGEVTILRKQRSQQTVNCQQMANPVPNFFFYANHVALAEMRQSCLT
jgi:hypothetical protein